MHALQRSAVQCSAAPVHERPGHAAGSGSQARMSQGRNQTEQSYLDLISSHLISSHLMQCSPPCLSTTTQLRRTVRVYVSHPSWISLILPQGGYKRRSGADRKVGPGPSPSSDFHPTSEYGNALASLSHRPDRSVL
jgi:hypothetical protein